MEPRAPEKNSSRPVMWCVAPVSTYQPSILSLLDLLRRKTHVRGSLRWSRAEPGDAVWE
jgi:hypothetical protein